MPVLIDTALPLPDDYYLLPLAHLYGSEWEMNFWDAIYYLAAHRGLPLGVTARTVATLMAGRLLDDERYIAIRHHFMRYWKEAVQAGWLIERTPSHQKAVKANTGTLRYNYRSTKRLYHFDLTEDSSGQGYLLKPRGYVENGWPGVITGAYPKRLLNFLLSQSLLLPAQAPLIYPLATLMNDFRINLRETAGLSSHPDLILEAINQLQDLNLVTCNGGRCQFNPSVLATLPPGHLAGGTDLVSQADWLTAQVEDPVRAQLALDTLKLGGWPQRLFWQVYRDMAYLDRSQLEQVYRYLANPAITSLEWTELLQQIRHPKLDTTSGEPIYSEKQIFDFSHQPTWRLPLQLPAETRLRLEIGGAPTLLSARLVIELAQSTPPSAPSAKVPVTMTLVNNAGRAIAPETTLELPPNLPQMKLNFDLTRLLQTSLNRPGVWFHIATPPDRPQAANWRGQIWLELRLRA